MSPLDLDPWRWARQKTYPDFAIPVEPLRAGFPTGTRRN